MLCASTRFPCSCCADDTKIRRRRAQKRRERQAIARLIRLTY